MLLSLVTAIQFSPPFLPSLYSLASAPGTEKALQTKKGRDKRRIKPCCRKQSKQRWARSFCVQSVHFKHDTCFLFLPSFPSASYQWSLADRYTLLLLFPFAGPGKLLLHHILHAHNCPPHALSICPQVSPFTTPAAAARNRTPFEAEGRAISRGVEQHPPSMDELILRSRRRFPRFKASLSVCLIRPPPPHFL